MTARLILFPILLLLAAAPAAQAAAPSCTRGGAKVHKRAGKVVVVKIAKRDFASTTKFLACWKPTGRRFTIGYEYDEEAGANNVLTITLHGRYVGTVSAGSSEIKAWRYATLEDVRTRRTVLRDTGCGERGDERGSEAAYFLRNGGLAYACGPVYLHRTPSSPRETLETGRAWDLTLFRRDGAEWLRWTAGGAQREQQVS